MQALKNWRDYQAFKALPRERKRIVFYSESAQDWHHFEPVIDYLTDVLGESICYLSSDPDDPGVSHDGEQISGFCIGRGLIRTVCFQWLQAGVMVMTMVDFNKLQLKRSVNPVSYAYMFHTLVSVHRADHEDSYDSYDAILCAGPHQMREIRKREELLHLPEKQLFPHGYHRLEELSASRRPPPEWSSNADIHILLAPSWGEQTILNLCGSELIQILLDAGFRITLRPHYQTRNTTPGILKHIVDKYAGHPRFMLVEDMAESDSLLDSHIMITDWSGAGIEYGLGLEKPVLYIDVPPKARNEWWPKIGLEPFESFVRDKIGAIVPPDKLEEIPNSIRELLEKSGSFSQRIESLQNEWVFNPDNSAAEGARAIADLAAQSDKHSELPGGD